MRIIKWVSLGLGALIALLVLAALLIIWFVDPNRFKPRIEAAVTGATGREFVLIGDIELGFFPSLALRSGAGTFANAPGFGAEPMASWDSAQLGAKLLPLLRGELAADRVRIDGLELRLVRHADGHSNWESLTDRPAATTGGDDQPPRIDGVQLRDATISIVDHAVVDQAPPRRVLVEKFHFTTDEIAPDKPFTDTRLSGVLHMDGFAAAGVPFALTLPRLLLGKDASSVAVESFEIEFGALEAEGAVHATMGDLITARGSIESETFDLRELLSQIGIEPPRTTDASVLGAVKFTVPWRYDSGGITLAPLALVLDDTHLAGDVTLHADADAGAPTSGRFALRGDFLDISRYLPPADPASEPFVLPVAALKALKFHGTLELERARLGDVDMKGVTLRLVLDEQGLRGEPE